MQSDLGWAECTAAAAIFVPGETPLVAAITKR